MDVDEYAIQLPFTVTKDSLLLFSIVVWCREQFGLGNFGKTVRKDDSCYWSFCYGSEYPECVLFNFLTQQQLNWFMLKWM